MTAKSGTPTSINSLRADHKNARTRTDQSAQLISESLSRYGAARSIVIDEDNRILAGNGTIEGAKAAGIKTVRVIETDGTEVIAVKRTGLSEDEKIGLALADNRTSDLSDWDQEMLRKLSEEHDLVHGLVTEDVRRDDEHHSGRRHTDQKGEVRDVHAPRDLVRHAGDRQAVDDLVHVGVAANHRDGSWVARGRSRSGRCCPAP